MLLKSIKDLTVVETERLLHALLTGQDSEQFKRITYNVCKEMRAYAHVARGRMLVHRAIVIDPREGAPE